VSRARNKSVVTVAFIKTAKRLNGAVAHCFKTDWSLNKGGAWVGYPRPRAVGISTSTISAQELIAHIERTLDLGTYRVGDWQTLLRTLKEQGEEADPISTPHLTRVSDKLHRRNGFPAAAAWVGMVGEYLLLGSSLLAMNAESILLRLAGVIVLASCLQPLIKITTGLALGVRYSYVYLWYVEPRFKMQFGTYHRLSPAKKLALQLMGSIGTPTALLIGWGMLQDEPLLSMLCLAGALIAVMMQVGAFFAVGAGVRKVGPFLLTNLTTPAMLAKEWHEVGKSTRE
jgi:hypothetical protein